MNNEMVLSVLTVMGIVLLALGGVSFIGAVLMLWLTPHRPHEDNGKSVLLIPHGHWFLAASSLIVFGIAACVVYVGSVMGERIVILIGTMLALATLTYDFTAFTGKQPPQILLEWAKVLAGVLRAYAWARRVEARHKEPARAAIAFPTPARIPAHRTTDEPAELIGSTH